MSAPMVVARYSRREELANSLTHGAGLALAVAGLAVLLAHAGARGTAWHVAGCGVYGATLVALSAASTLNHGVPTPRAKAALRACDHAAIFLLIAGTYTPFALVNLRGAWGWSLLAAIWGQAALGIALQRVLARQRAAVRATPYLAMGWVAVVAVEPLRAAVAPGGLALLLAGGLAYAGGAAFYAWRRLPYHYAIWHAFVLAGGACHFFAVLFFVIRLAG
jgi:hemolysin III